MTMTSLARCAGIAGAGSARGEPCARRPTRAGAAGVGLRRGHRGAGRAGSRRPRRSSCRSPRATASTAGDVIARLDTTDAELAHRARRRPSARRPTRSCGCSQAGVARRRTSGRREAQVAAAQADVARGATRSSPPRDADVAALRGAARSQRRLAQAARRCGDAAGRGARRACRGARGRARAAREALARARAPARGREEIDAARARVAAVDAQIATLEKSVADADRHRAGRRRRHREAGRRRRARRAAHAARRRHRPRPRVGERLRRRAGSCRGCKLGQPATLVTDAGRPARRARSPSSRRRRSSRRATCRRRTSARSSSTASRSPSTTRDGVLKPGMPVEAELACSRSAGGRHDRPPSRFDRRHEALRRDDARSTACRFDVAPRRDVRPDRPDGAGKTTTIRADLRAAARRRRAACACSASIRSREHRAVTASVGYLSQRFSLYGDLRSTRTSRSSPRSTACATIAARARPAARDDAAHAVPRRGWPIGCPAA